MTAAEDIVPKLREIKSSSAAAKDSARDKIAADVEAFLASGGKIQKMEIQPVVYKPLTPKDVIANFKKPKPESTFNSGPKDKE